MALDSSGVLGAAQQFAGQTDAAATKLMDVLGSLIDTSGQMVDNQVSTGSRVQDGRTIYNTPLQAATENAAALEAQLRTQEFAKMIGINPDAAADIQMQLADTLVNASRATIEQGKKVADLNSVGLFDDPLTFLVNQVLLPDEVNKLTSQQAVVENARVNLAAINQSVQQTAVTSNTIQTHITASNLDDQMTAIEADLKMKKDKLRMDNQLQTAHAIKDIWNMDQAKFGIAKDIWQINRSEEALAMQREAHRLAVERENVAMLRYKDEQAALAHRLDLINKAEVEQLGTARTSLEDLRVKTAADPEFAKYTARMAEMGSSLKAGLPVTVGDSILERVKYFQSTPPKQGITPAGLALVKLQSDAVAKAMEENKGAKPEVINAAAEALFSKQLDNWARKVDPKDQTNPFALLPYAAYDQATWINKNPAYQYFRTVVKENEPADINKFMHTVVPAIASGKVSYKDAAQAITYMAESSRQASDVVNDIYFLTGRKVPNIQVPVQYYSGSQLSARVAAGAGAGGTLAAAGTGVGLPVAGLLGLTTAGLAAYSANPQTTLIDPSNKTKVEQALISMLPLSINTGVGADALKPAVQRKGANQ